MDKRRLQLAKMCIYIEEVFFNDLISCVYDNAGDIATIVVEYPLYKYALLFSFIIPDKPWKYFYQKMTKDLEAEVKIIIRKGAREYGYITKN